MRAFITGEEFKRARLPIVYIWKRGEEWLYVGMSKCGIARIFSNGHHAINLENIQDTDTIKWISFDTVKEAQSREEYLITMFQPKYNTKLTSRRRLLQKFQDLGGAV